MIVGIIGFVFACVPGALIIGWVLLPAAFILGIVGVLQSGSKKATSISAIIVSIVGAVVGAVVFFTLAADSFSDAFGKSDLSPDGSASPRETSDGSASRGAGEGNSSRGTRDDPLAIGETVSNDEWTVTLGQPAEAWGAIAAENRFNDPPAPGMEYWVVPVRATYTGSDTGNPTWDITVQFVGSDNRTYSDYCGVIPDPLSDIGELYAGGVAEGNVCVAVPAGADGLWTLKTGFIGDPIFFE